MRVAHFNPSQFKASSSSFAATAFFGFLNPPMRRPFAESAKNVDHTPLPDWAKAIIQHPQPTRIHRIHKGQGHGSQWTPSDLAFIMLATDRVDHRVPCSGGRPRRGPRSGTRNLCCSLSARLRSCKSVYAGCTSSST
jgi:hypothetical protein